MAFVHIRIEDDFYKAVQAAIKSKLNTEISSFVRDVLKDALLIYGDPTSASAAFAAAGRKHEAQGKPSLVLDMASDWHRAEGADILARVEEMVYKSLLGRLDRYLLGPLGPKRMAKRLERLIDEDLHGLWAKVGSRADK
ncbi:MAG: hypothetical protein ABSB82_06230 [Terriglobia bacterium]|jgi:hypothetical protein